MSTYTNSGKIAPERPEGAVGEDAGLVTAREHRNDLRQAMSWLENRAARPSATATWRADVEAALLGLGAALEAHIADVEGEDGLLDSIVADAPRLSGQIADMRRQHDELRAGLDRAIVSCTTHGKTDPVLVRRRVTSLLGRLAMHRQLGSELVFDAYNLDIGDGD